MESGKAASGEAATSEESKMRGEAHVAEAASYPIIVRSNEPVADLDERLRRIFSVLSLPALEELDAEGPCLTRSAMEVASVSAGPLGMGSGDRFEVCQGDSGLLEGGVRLADKTA
jgi:hypothetical protein